MIPDDLMPYINMDKIAGGDLSGLEPHEISEARKQFAQGSLNLASLESGEPPLRNAHRRARAPELDRMLRVDTVMRMSGLSYATLWRHERAGTFPKRRKIGKRAVGWLESEVRAWQANGRR